MQESKYISFIPFSALFNWSVQYLSETRISFNANYPMVRIGEFLKRNKTVLLVDNNQKYKRATIKVRNGGVYLRDIEIGSKIGTKSQFIITQGQFLLSKIDARNGAFGVVPEELDGGIITGNFWAFDVDYNMVNPHYLSLVVTTPEFIQFCEQASNGTTNRHYLQEPLFLDIKIPLPTIEEQNELVRAYNERINNAVQQEDEAANFESEIENYMIGAIGIEKQDAVLSNTGLQFIKYKQLFKWALSDILKESLYLFNNVVFEIKTLREIITFFDGGKTPSTSQKDYWGDDVFWTSAKDMKESYLSNITDKISFKGASESNLKIYPEGTILGVFRSGILRHSFPICITAVPTTINQDIKAIGINERIMSKLYFVYYLSILQSFVLERSQKKGVTVESINTGDFLAIPMVCPPIKIQNEIVAHITELKNKIKELKAQAVVNRSSALNEFEKQIFK